MATKSVSRSSVSLGRPKEKIHELIAKRAYDICQRRGSQSGNEWADWFEAEKQVKSELQSDLSRKKS
ncbi:MAG: DUF2934 domain-containing protein [Candidatus Omnitrophica bacterium]|nr:DUF2934 domain-containing protein [Candidatus Omnitrophota bacterium]